MRDTFSSANPRDRNTRQTQRKSLETKLAILFQPKPRTASKMRRTGTGEIALFSTSGIRKYLTLPERRRFCRAIQALDPARRLFCIVLMWSGGRVSEVLALTPAAVDLESGSVVLLTLKCRKRGVVRQIPLPRPLMRELATKFAIRKMQQDPARARQRLWPWSRTTAWRLIKNVMARASIVTLAASPKGLRHTFGVSAFQAKVPPHLVQRWLGHASLRTTAIYGDVIDEEERQFASQMWRRF